MRVISNQVRDPSLNPIFEGKHEVRRIHYPNPPDRTLRGALFELCASSFAVAKPLLQIIQRYFIRARHFDDFRKGLAKGHGGVNAKT